MSKRCYYETLGCPKGATIDALKASYRKLAMKFHPDRNPGDATAEVQFKEINEAYDVLKDDQKRAAYDRFGHAAFEAGMGRAGAAGFDFAGSFSDVFEDFFGDLMGGRRAKRGNRGQDLRYNLEITLEEAFRGRSAEIKVPTLVSCETCHGSGAEPGHDAETCPTCSGHGKVRATQGFFTIERSCAQCRGTGKIIRHPCKACRGAGTMQKERALTVDVPPGVEEGTRIRLSGEGAAGLNGGPNGDLYIFLSVTEHPIFQRDGHNLHCRAPVSFVTAALGGCDRSPHPGWRPRQGDDPRRDPAGAPIPPQSQGHAGPAQRPARRPLYRGRGRDPGQALQAAEGIAAGIRKRKQSRLPARGGRVHGPAERVLERRRDRLS